MLNKVNSLIVYLIQQVTSQTSAAFKTEAVILGS